MARGLTQEMRSSGCSHKPGSSGDLPVPAFSSFIALGNTGECSVPRSSRECRSSRRTLHLAQEKTSGLMEVDSLHRTSESLFPFIFQSNLVSVNKPITTKQWTLNLSFLTWREFSLPHQPALLEPGQPPAMGDSGGSCWVAHSVCCPWRGAWPWAAIC